MAYSNSICEMHRRQNCSPVTGIYLFNVGKMIGSFVPFTKYTRLKLQGRIVCTTLKTTGRKAVKGSRIVPFGRRKGTTRTKRTLEQSFITLIGLSERFKDRSRFVKADKYIPHVQDFKNNGMHSRQMKNIADTI